ncbi:hypothetical protein EUGRSUZ_F00568 [Eucalyptus grandis]|uniref:Uncharacterized protein n=2 Tax=Eucalyptus grandis TaxID=71139 RepID=A0ACC3KE37_EUCGR|nr:hypothetical protein EUGRSUZ_F00568 [Eucalyptus grandis]
MSPAIIFHPIPAIKHHDGNRMDSTIPPIDLLERLTHFGSSPTDFLDKTCVDDFTLYKGRIIARTFTPMLK